jgi:hypothetical protein
MALDLIIKWEPCEIEIGAHKISMELLPLSREKMIALVPYMKRNDDSALVDAYKMQGEAKPILAGNMRNLRGLTINGEEPSIETLCSESVCCGIVAKILTELVVRSSLKEDEAKN